MNIEAVMRLNTVYFEVKDADYMILFSDVDCTSEGKPLCDEVGVKVFIVLFYDYLDGMEKHDGGWDLASLQSFTAESLQRHAAEGISCCGWSRDTIF